MIGIKRIDLNKVLFDKNWVLFDRYRVKQKSSISYINVKFVCFAAKRIQGVNFKLLNSM